LRKVKLLMFPLFIGVVFVIYSWCLSYPLSIDSLNDFIYNHVPILYWFGLPLIFASTFLIAVATKRHSSKLIMTVIFIVTIYSFSYFYPTLPGSDSHYFRGLNEYFTATKDLDPLKAGHSYFQWPSFFLLIDIAISICGMPLVIFEFLLYTIIGFLLTTALYVYASKVSNNGFMAVVAFFIAMYYFLNYQCVPFSLAFSFLFILFMLETKQKKFNTMFSMLLLFICMSFVHAFVPLFFVLYLLIRFILNRSKSYGHLFILTTIIYLVVQITQAQHSFAQNVKIMTTLTSEYSKIFEATLSPAHVPIDIVAQTFSRTVTITTIAICLAGFMILLIKRKLRDLDKAILITGAVYSIVGGLFFILGSRAFPIFFIPVSLGASYLLEGRFRRYIKSLFLILLILFVFIPLHVSFYDSQIFFQTKQAYCAENFMIDQYNWTRPSLILAHFRVITYLRTKQPSMANFENDVSSPLFPRLKEYDCIVYTIGLGKNLLRYNYTTEKILREEKFDMIYDNGFSYIAIKSSNFIQRLVR